jgi:hypothetical protein
MHDSRGVRAPERVTELAEDLEDLRGLEMTATPELLRERHAFEELHHDEEEAALFVDSRVDHLRDVVAANRRADARFLFEAPSELGVLRELVAHHFERASRAGGELLDLEDGSHPAFGEWTDDAVRSADDIARL